VEKLVEQTVGKNQVDSVKAKNLQKEHKAWSLDAINFLLADVRGALGPYLNVYLVTQRHWSQSEVGFVTSIGGFIGLLAQTPIGAYIDHTNAKRGTIVVALVVLSAGALTLFFFPFIWPVMFANALVAIVGDVFGPAVAALTLGLYARKQLAKRLGRNSSFDHAGNIVAALVAALVGYLYKQEGVFLLVPVFSIFAIASVLSIPPESIDQARARGLNGKKLEKTNILASLKVLLQSKPLLIFSLCAFLFHFANAPLLPLVGQKLALAHPKLATPLTSACIVVAQLVMLPMALLVGNKADQWGRKPLFLLGFAALPVRALLYTFSNDPTWLIVVQILDGVGAGIFIALAPLLIADVMHGTGHYNLAQGAVVTCEGIGGSLSGLLTGLAVDRFGYNFAFFSLSAVSFAAFIAFLILMPETKPQYD
jgi:MFS family permease